MKYQVQEMMHFFISQGLLSDDQLKIIVEEKINSIKPLDQIGHELNFYTKDDCLKVKAKFYDLEYIDLEQYMKDGLLGTRFQQYNEILSTLSAVVYDETDHDFFVAVEDPFDIVGRDNIRDALNKYFAKTKKLYFAFGNFDKWLSIQYIQKQISSFEQNEVIEELNAFIEKAIEYNASDIHIMPDEKITCLYFRRHGKLVLQKTWHKKFEARLLSRLKILSGLDIAQCRIPQSGRYIFQYHNRSVDLRVSTHPTIYGEKLAIRVLDTYKIRHDLEFLGFHDQNLQCLQQCLGKQQGLIILAGATGSGKTTTLYACLDYLNKQNLNIMTLEDPVESSLGYASQMEVSQHVDYVEGIRSILRQDPDVILIGEIRDEDTAKMAFRASMTGHLVLSTIHAQGLAGIFARLNDLGIQQAMIKEFMLCAIYQELQPRYHDNCHQNGCPDCFGTGIIGLELKCQLQANSL